MDWPAELSIAFELNHEPVKTLVLADTTLLALLRERFGITAVRGACGEGVCGSCAVVVNGRVISACLLLAAAVDGATVLTPEGLAMGNELSRVQEAFVAQGAYQCSFCIPAMALTVQARLDAMPEATAEDLRESIQGNLCRCGTYPQITDAIVAITYGGQGDDE